MTFLKAYAKVLKYSTELPALMKMVAEQPHEDTNRLVLADALADEGRHIEEAHCRDLSKPIFIHDNKVWGAAPKEVYDEISKIKNIPRPHRDENEEVESYSKLYHDLKTHHDPAHVLLSGINQYAFAHHKLPWELVSEQHGIPEYDPDEADYESLGRPLETNGGGLLVLHHIVTPTGHRTLSYTFSPRAGVNMIGYLPRKQLKPWLHMIVAPHEQEVLKRFIGGDNPI
jgi:uncharacterized protein (TIGR02996 family)